MSGLPGSGGPPRCQILNIVLMRSLDSLLMKHAVENRLWDAQYPIPAFVRPFRRSQIHHARLVSEHPRDLVRTDLEKLRSLRYGVELLLHFRCTCPSSSIAATPAPVNLLVSY